MKHGVSRDLYSYWNALRAGRTAPERGDIDPAAIRHVLAYTFILEVSPGPMAQAREVTFRLSGTRLNALFQRDLKSRPFSDIWLPDGAELAETVLNVVLDDRAATVAGVVGSPRGYDAATFEMLLLPLRHHGKTHARLLGSVAASVAPTWIGLYPIEGLVIHSFQHVRQVPALEASDHFGLASPRPGPGRLPASEPQGPAGVTQVGAFTVYQGGQRRPQPADA